MKILKIEGNHKKVTENSRFYESFGSNAKEGIDSKFIQSNYPTNINMIWKDLSRASFIPSNGKNFNDYCYSWIQDLSSSAAYRQENMSAGDSRNIMMSYVLKNPNFIKAHPEYKNNNEMFLAGDNIKVFNFGYYDDQGEPCAFSLTYTARDPSMWVASVIKKATSDPEDRLVTIITPEKMIYQPENSPPLSNNETISTLNTENIQDQLIMSLNSAEIAKQLSGMMNNNGTVNIDRLKKLSKMPEHASYKLNEKKLEAATTILNRADPTSSWDELPINDVNQHFKDYLILSSQKTNNIDEHKELSSILTDMVLFEHKQQKSVNHSIALEEFIDQIKSKEEKEIVSAYIESRNTQLDTFINELTVLAKQLPDNVLMQEILANAKQLNPLNSFREESVNEYITAQQESKIKQIQTAHDIEKAKIIPPTTPEDMNTNFFQRNIPELIIAGLSFLAIGAGLALTFTGILAFPGIILTGIGIGVAATIGGLDVAKIVYDEIVLSNNINAYNDITSVNQSKSEALNLQSANKEEAVINQFNQIKEKLKPNLSNDEIVRIDQHHEKLEQNQYMNENNDVVINIDSSYDSSEEEKTFNEINSALERGEQAIKMANANPDTFVYSKKSVVYATDPVVVTKEFKQELIKTKSTRLKQDEDQLTDEQTKSPINLGH